MHRNEDYKFLPGKHAAQRAPGEPCVNIFSRLFPPFGIQKLSFRVRTDNATPEFNQRNDLRQLENPVYPDCVFAVPSLQISLKYSLNLFRR